MATNRVYQTFVPMVGMEPDIVAVLEQHLEVEAPEVCKNCKRCSAAIEDSYEVNHAEVANVIAAMLRERGIEW